MARGKLRIQDEQLASFLQNFSHLTRMASQASDVLGGTPLLPVLAAHLGTAHLGTAPGALPVVLESFAAHRLVDASGIMDSLLADDPASRVHGLAGQQRRHLELSDLVAKTRCNPVGWASPTTRPSRWDPMFRNASSPAFT
ncbi:hypothetical protein ACIGB6_18000 [Paeniglutamicibacter gangotriensis]|uniref:hypothetical protein n=1 Tax=Paeniglutamicibacter gangotriensis TaxID=254787 RepID=UPI001269612D|nr:hypothetical protein [Paeniglutamicibacter gangotriensis]